MKTEWRRFAPFGLYLALIAALSAAGLYIIQQEFNLYVQISLALIVVGLAVYAALDPDRVRNFLGRRQARYGSNALVMALAFLGILVVINFLVYKNPKRWDLTEDESHTLAAETLSTLESLPQPVQAVAFYPPDANSEQAKDILEDYKFYSDGKFDYQFIDPVADPIAARNANVSLEAGGTVVVNMGDRQEKVNFLTEQELTGALVRLMSEAKSVYFLTEHGEYSPEQTGEQSLSQVRQALELKNYTVQSLNLLANRQIPDDAQVIVIAGPRKPITEEEVQLLKDYLAAGGSLVVLEEPLPLTDFAGEADPLADYLASDWGLIFGQDVIVDLTSNQPFQVYAAEYSNQHPITQKLRTTGTAFPTARSVKVGQPQGVVVSEIIYTASQSWAETDLASLEANQQPQPNEGQDIIGRVPLASTAEQQETGGRIVAIGDADFAIDANFQFLGNGDLFVNSIDWAAEQENLINLTPKESTPRVLLQPQTLTKWMVWLGSVLVPAGLVLLAGIMVAIQRRKQG